MFLFQLSLSWLSEDSESGIQFTDVGLGSSITSMEDVLPWTETSGHHHFVTYHPYLSSGKEFYIHIRATNGAGINTVAVSIALIGDPLKIMTSNEWAIILL